MKVLIAYMSHTGRTKKIAEAMFEEIREEKEIKELFEIDDLEGYDFVFVGFPLHGFGMPREAQRFFEKHGTGKKVALFVTHGAPESAKELVPWLKNCRDAAACAEVIDMFNCQGELAQYIADELLKSDDPVVRSWGDTRHSKGQPDEARVESARAFARDIMERVKGS